MITSSDTGGAESMLSGLISRLDRRLFSPHLISLRPAGRIARDLAELAIPVKSLEMSERASLPQLLAAIRQLAEYVDQNEIDLVQTLLYRANVVGPLAAKLSSRRPVIVTSQHSYAPLVGRLPVLAARLTRRLSPTVVAVCQAIRQDLITTDGTRADKIVVIPNGLDTDNFQKRDESSLRDELGIDRQELVIGAVGRLSRVKGFDHLLQGVAALNHASRPFRLLIAGEGPERQSLERLADRLGIRQRVEFLGLVQDMENFYSCLDIFVLSSLREAAPYALLEAMATCCPVVATAVGGVPEIVDDRVNGLLVSPESATELGRSLSELADDSNLRSRLGQAARERVSQRFDIGLTVSRYESLYSELLEGRS